MEHLYMSLQNNVNGEKRQLEERVIYLEQQIASNKQAAFENEDHLRITNDSIQQELQKAIASQILNKERAINLKKEKEDLSSQMQSKLEELRDKESSYESKSRDTI